MVSKLIFDEKKKYFNVKLDNQGGGGDEERGLKRNRKAVMMVTT